MHLHAIPTGSWHVPAGQGGVNGTQASGTGTAAGSQGRAAHVPSVVPTRGVAPLPGAGTGHATEEGGCAPAGQPRAVLARHGGWARHRHGAHVAPTWEPGRASAALKPPFVPGQPLALGIQVVPGGARRKPSNRVLGSARQRGTNAPSSAGRTGTKSSWLARGALPGPPPCQGQATCHGQAGGSRGGGTEVLAPPCSPDPLRAQGPPCA